MSWGRGKGPLADLLAVADVAARAMHQVAFAVKADFLLDVQERRIEVVDTIPSKSLRAITDQFYSDFAAFQGLDDPAYVEDILLAEQRACQQFRPDVIVSHLQPTASITARSIGLKHLSRASWTEHPKFTSPVSERYFGTPEAPPSSATPVFNGALRSRSLPEVHDFWNLCFMYSDAKFAPSIPGLEPGLMDVEGLTYVGYLSGINPGRAVAPWLKAWAGERAIRVFVYLSAKDIGPDVYCPLLVEALDTGEFEVLVAVGGAISSLPPIARNGRRVRFVEWVPGDFVIAHSDVVVCMGTRGTSLQALMAGAGLVLFPGEDDELFFFTHKLEELGVGHRLSRDHLDASELRDAVAGALDAATRSRSRELGRKIIAAGGPARVVRMIEELGRSSQTDTRFTKRP